MLSTGALVVSFHLLYSTERDWKIVQLHVLYLSNAI